MLDSHTSAQLTKQQQRGANQRPPLSMWALGLRVIPLTVSFVLFVFAASVDVQRWGSHSVQAMLIVALGLGVLGVAIFIPKRRFPK
jgi:hypothetical protein